MLRPAEFLMRVLQVPTFFLFEGFNKETDSHTPHIMCCVWLRFVCRKNDWMSTDFPTDSVLGYTLQGLSSDYVKSLRLCNYLQAMGTNHVAVSDHVRMVGV